MTGSYRVLSTPQMNQVAALATAAELALADFDWSIVEGGRGMYAPATISRLVHGPTRAWLEFDYGEVYWLRWWPQIPRLDFSQSGTWEAILPVVERWMAAVAEEHRSPRLWDIAKTERMLLVPPDTSENAPFSRAEQEALAITLREIGAFIVHDSQVEREAVQRVEAKIDYLVDASTRLGRKDFLNMVGGALVGMVLQAGLTAERAQAFLAYASAQLGPVLGYLRALT